MRYGSHSSIVKKALNRKDDICEIFKVNWFCRKIADLRHTRFQTRNEGRGNRKYEGPF